MRMEDKIMNKFILSKEAGKAEGITGPCYVHTSEISVDFSLIVLSSWPFSESNTSDSLSDARTSRATSSVSRKHKLHDDIIRPVCTAH